MGINRCCLGYWIVYRLMLAYIDTARKGSYCELLGRVALCAELYGPSYL